MERHINKWEEGLKVFYDSKKNTFGQDTDLLYNADLLVRTDYSRVSDYDFYIRLRLVIVAYTIYCTCKFVGGEGINVVVVGLDVAKYKLSYQIV